MLNDTQLLEAAQRFSTPLYVYDAAELDAALAGVRAAFTDTRIFYAMKANPNLSLLRRFRSAGVGFECVSAGELARAVKAGASGEHILVNGPAKSDEEYAEGGRLGATFIVDRGEEVALLPPSSRALVRVNPALSVSTHDHLATGAGSSKFGVPLSEVAAVVEALKAAGHTARGLHVHIGSAIRDAGDFAAAFAKLSELRPSVGELEVLDVGGGWSLDADLHGIAGQARQAAEVFGAQLWAEPGRYLVAGAGVLLSTVVGSKQTGRDFVLLDAGMTELIRPMLYGAVQPIRALWQGDQTKPYDLAGPACESGDVLAHDVPLPTPQRGGVLALLEAGAYGAAMSSNYLSRPRPAEVLWDGSWQVIRQREGPEAIWAAEL
ncbi:diaminopimelate decarboxylase [Deinococcus psychrotolerans]|uniref:Diaminopimelate decarboxylase n=1 Tax=Deinococcus psychrotolerans TaxID=2489213 RepID=A0A3G8Y884_9DEIO|nr:diaminopimelate decarboxylase [Deinococcus psychrotolerans]AZI41395.1 diaminopimelate decarboxylase [Deinococcus psychrotolerans]